MWKGEKRGVVKEPRDFASKLYRRKIDIFKGRKAKFKRRNTCC